MLSQACEFVTAAENGDLPTVKRLKSLVAVSTMLYDYGKAIADIFDTVSIRNAIDG